MRLLEPLGLLDGEPALAAMRSGLAFPLAGGPAAFCLVRLIEADGTTSAPLAARDIPPEWRAGLDALTGAPPPWAGLPPQPCVMGVVNVTPDSFSDGGDHLAPAAAIAAGLAMVRDGAALLDVGGESTRPREADIVTPAQEQARILPVLRGLAGCGAVLSVDTRNAATMAAALAAGAHVVNDISALTHDPLAAAAVARAGCPVVLMHMRGTPQTMHRHASYRDVAVEVVRELAARIAAAEEAGIPRRLIAVDPGIGFAKNLAENAEMLRRLPLLLNLGCRVVLGVSRKRFIGTLSESGGAEPGGRAPASPKDRMPGSLAAALFGVARGASILRVHDVAATTQALRVWQGLAIPPTVGTVNH